MIKNLTYFAALMAMAVAAPALADTVPTTPGTPAAGVFNFDYTSGGATPSYYGAGTITTDNSGLVTDITGSANGSAITGLSNYASADNMVYSTPAYVTFNGLSFSTAFDTYNIGNTLNGDYGIAAQSTNPGGYCCSAEPLTVNVSAVPEPATWGMMLLGFGALGVSLRTRSQRKELQVA